MAKRWKMRDLIKKLEIGIEELIILFLIVLEILDWATVIPPVLEFAEKTLAVIAMCYLFYKASMTSIATGIKGRKYDVMIVIAYLAMSLKTIIGFVMTAWLEEESTLHRFYDVILSNAYTIESAGLWVGGLTIITVTYFLAQEKVGRKSILWMIHERDQPKTLREKTIHFISTYLTLMSIFLVLFQYAMEWLALTVDAPILVIVLFLYLFVVVKRGKKMKAESFLRRVSSASETFYERFIGLFHSRKTFFIAIGGLLVLHLLVDIGHFIIPYTTGLMYPWYFPQLGPGHTPLGTLMAQDFAAAADPLVQTGVILVYVINVIAALLLFFGPAYIWIEHYTGKRLEIWRYAGIFFGAAAAFFLRPVLKISKLNSPTMLGVDVTTQNLSNVQDIWWVLLAAGLCAAIFWALSRRYREGTGRVMKLSALIYFGIYVGIFFLSLAKYYTAAFAALFQNHRYFMAADMLLFLTITVLFYIGGYAIFVYQTFTHAQSLNKKHAKRHTKRA